MKKLWNRESLKNFFRKGQSPTETHFAYLIDSQVNKIDDGFAKSDEEGLKLAPAGSETTVMSIYKSSVENLPEWQVNIGREPGRGRLCFDAVRPDQNGKLVRESKMVLSEMRGVGIGTSDPRTALEVNGTAGLHTRVGTYQVGEADADGTWRPVLSQLSAPSAFEVVARVDGGSGRGKYAVTHAIALGTFGGGKNTIRQTRSYYGPFWNRIDLRWKSEGNLYHLEIRTYQHYGLKPDGTVYKIRYHVSALLDDALFK